MHAVWIESNRIAAVHDLFYATRQFTHPISIISLQPTTVPWLTTRNANCPMCKESFENDDEGDKKTS